VRFFDFIKNISIDYLKIFFKIKNLTNEYYDCNYIKKIKVFSANKNWKKETITCLKYVKSEKISKVLDVGCNAGFGTEAVRKYLKTNIYGADTSKIAIKQAKKNFYTIRKNFKHYDGVKLPFKDNYFDLVVSFHVIGHVQDANKFIKELNRVTKSGKKVIIITPNAIYKIFSIVDSLINKYSPDMSINKYWFSSELKKLFLKNKFKDINIFFIGELPIILRWLKFNNILKSRIAIIATKINKKDIK